jgi:hypothetical protein
MYNFDNQRKKKNQSFVIVKISYLLEQLYNINYFTC